MFLFLIIISELLQSNVETLMVEHDFPDSWVELYNPGPDALSLAGWSLGLTPDVAQAYTLDSTAIVPAQGHLLLYCDKRAQGLHTSFRLDSGGGWLCLFDSSGQIADSLTYPAMLAPDIAYARSDVGEGYHPLRPTPGGVNDPTGSESLAPDPLFSHPSALLSEPMEVQITLPEEAPSDALIYWTTDGSEPDSTSAHATQVSLEVAQSLVVRAKVMAQGMHCVPSVTRSYIFHPRTTDIPIVSIATRDAYLFDDEIGLLSGRKNDPEANFNQDWRRPIHIEYLDWAPTDVRIDQLAECAVGGVSSRNFAQKSLKVYANKRFGTKRLKGHLWSDKPEVGKVKSLMLRNGGSRNDGGMLHDALAQRLFGLNDPALDWQAYEPVIVYINGQYRGVYELRERADEDYVEANHDCEDIIQNNRFYGGDAEWNALRRRAEKGATYEELEAEIDLDNFSSYLTAEVFAGNTDWPGNNVFVWRPDTVGGRWRAILKDLDQFSYYESQRNYLNYVFLRGEEAQKEQSTGRYLHHSVLCALNDKEEFRSLFVHKLAVALGDFLRPEFTLPLFEQMASRIRPELAPTKLAWGNRASLDWVDHEWDSIRSYLQLRPADLYAELNDYYELGGVVDLSVTAAEDSLLIAGLPLRTGSFQGSWFMDEPLHITTSGIGSCWNVTLTYQGGATQTEVFYRSSLELLPSQFGPDLCSISIQLTHDAAISSVHADPVASSPLRYNLLGQPVYDSAHSRAGILLMK